MAKHFMAVCVVCLLCADHLPCKEHIGGEITRATKIEGSSLPRTSDVIKLRQFSPNLVTTANPVDQRSINSFDTSSNHRTKKDSDDDEVTGRQKRHASGNNHQHSTNSGNGDIENSSKIFIKKIFERFGNSNEMTMDLTGFENMLKHLGLFKLIVEQLPSPSSSDQDQHQNDAFDDSCINSLELITRVLPHTSSHLAAHDLQSLIISGQNSSTVAIKESLQVNRNSTSPFNNSPTLTTTTNTIELNSPFMESNNSSDENFNNILKNKNISHMQGDNKLDSLKKSIKLNTNDMWTICPILLYQLAGPTSPERLGCIHSSLLPSKQYLQGSNIDVIADDGSDKNVISGLDNRENRTLVWVYSSLSILGVSLCGLLGVAVIPCMEKKYYHNILQFLVALAIGTLCGDALLHLMPHAMISNSLNGDIHVGMTLKGLVAVLGIIFLYGTERGLTMIAEWRKERQKKEKLPSRVRVMRDPESASLNNSTGEKLCKHKYSSYPYCYDEIEMETKDDHHHHHAQHNSHEKTSPSVPIAGKHHHNPKNNSIIPSYRNHHHNHKDDNNIDHNETSQSLIDRTPNNYTISDDYTTVLDKKSFDEQESQNITSVDNNTVSTNLEDGGSIENNKTGKNLMYDEKYTIILREHESKHHGHSHTHGHVHSPPSSLSSVAWMVVMGDGLHNFTDGMAIGAAFSNNIAGGFSTAIAVFCHELPHELGDFAVLLKAGMSARQAVYYNLLSSVLSFFGMILGVIVGDTPEASSWIFAAAAGMFIYIALVDMMPELTSSHREQCAFSTSLLQIFGMIIGLCAMALIALYENDLKGIFTANGHNHDHDHHHHHHH